MACGRCGGAHAEGICDVGGTAGNDLLLGFLSDFRSALEPPKPAADPDDPLAAIPGPVRGPEPAAAPAPVFLSTSPSASDVASAPLPASPVAPHIPHAAPLPPLAEPSWAPPVADSAWAPPAADSAPAWLPPPAPLPTWDPPVYPYGVQATAPPGPMAPPYPAPRGRRGGAWRGVLAAIAAIAVIAAAAVVVHQRGSGGPSYPAAWDPRIAPIAQFVQTERGLTWMHPVKVEFLPTARFDALMAKENAPDPKSTQDAQVMFDAMRAIGVASGNVDLAKSAQQFAQADVVGQYVFSDHTVYVRGDTLTPYVRSVLAHELTHALQAQYFNLDKIRAGHADDDGAVTALIEGDAVRVQNAYEQQLSPADQNLLDQEQQAGSDQANSQNSQDGIPQFMVDQAEFPYDFGPTFVAALMSKGGNSQVDNAFRDPPTVDGQIIDPTTYVPGGGTPTVTAPGVPKGAQQVMPPSGFGEITLLEMLGDQVGFAPAWLAVQGWMQDQMVSYRQNGQVCVDLAVLNDTTTSATGLARAGKAWAGHLPSASVSQSGTTVDFHGCDPGPGWKPSVHVDDPYQAIAVRSVLLYQLMTAGHLSTTVATCAADQLMTTMGPRKLQDAEQSSDPTAPASQQLRSGVAAAVVSCN